MRKAGIYTVFIFLTFIGLVSCGETEPTAPEDSVAEYTPDKEEVVFDEYIAGIDGNDSLRTGNSLFYSKGEGEFTEVEFFVNEKNEMVKMIEYYTQESMTVAKNIFYFKDGRKFATKELFEDGEGEAMHFVERVSYYGEDEKPIITKRKVATYEQDLDYESYEVAPSHDCDMTRALEILNQEGEFNTTFQGFVKEDVFQYIIVGGSDPDDFSSSLVVQYVDNTIMKLQQNELDMIGTPLTINFETVEDAGEGFEYQILMSATIR